MVQILYFNACYLVKMNLGFNEASELNYRD